MSNAFSDSLYSEYEAGLKELEGFERIILVFRFHRSEEEKLVVPPPHEQGKLHGVFATCSPNSINSIGISWVKLIKMEKNILEVEGVDMLDGTPLLDIKPYIPQLDCFAGEKTSWFGEHRSQSAKTDEVF